MHGDDAAAESGEGMRDCGEGVGDVLSVGSIIERHGGNELETGDLGDAAREEAAVWMAEEDVFAE